MENKNHSNSFLLGVILGVIITLLFTTKKGRKILKALSEEGLQKFTELEDIWEERRKQLATDSVMSEQDMGGVEESIEDELLQKSSETNGSIPKISTGRRFFRGTPKHG